MIQLCLIVAVLAVLFYHLAIKPMTYWKERGVKQGKKVWLLGDNWRNLFRLESLASMLTRMYTEIPGVRYSGSYQFTVPILVIKDPDLIKQIGVKDFEYFTDHRSFIPEDCDPLWSKNLFALKGQKWRDMRPILSPSFTSSKMKGIFLLIAECSKNFTQHFLAKDQNIVEVEIKDVFRRFANDVIATTAFGVKIDSLENPTNDFYLMGKEATDFGSFFKMLKILSYLVVPKLHEIFKVTVFDKHVRKFFTELIDNTVKTRREKGIVRPDMIHLLMQAQNDIQQKDENGITHTGFATFEGESVTHKMTNFDIAAQAMIFFSAGFETVSSVMCFMAYELAINLVIQEKLRKEIEEILQEYRGSLTYEAVQKMKYMDMVVSETLRKWPGAVLTDRVCTKPYTITPVNSTEKPLDLKEGACLWIPVLAIHRDPAIYPDPERFDPERFSDENKGNINPYSYIPFGFGPRNCIGNRFALLEIKIIMFHILSEFELVPTAKSEIPLKLSKKQFNLEAENGVWLRLKPLRKHLK